MESKPGGNVNGYGSVVPSVVNVIGIVVQGWVVVFGFFHISENKFQKDKNDIIRSCAFSKKNAEVDTHNKSSVKN